MSKLAALIPVLAILSLSSKPAAAAEPAWQLTDIALYMMQDLCPRFYYKKIKPSEYELSGHPLYLQDALDPNEEKGNWLKAEAFPNQMAVFVSTVKNECRMDYFGEHDKAFLTNVRLLLKRDGYSLKVGRNDKTTRIEEYSIRNNKNFPYHVLLLENKSNSGVMIKASY